MVGVEEELLLVDARTGRPSAVASELLRVADAHGEVAHGDDVSRGSLVHEFQEQQVELYTPPESDLAALAADLRQWRHTAACRAAEVGAQVMASGTSPMPVTPELMDDARYRRISQHLALTAREQLSCAGHVHVAVESVEEAVGVLDRIRVWLPTILALSANSPLWKGQDSGYASYRTQAVARWPMTGPTELFGSAAGYRRHLSEVLGSGVPLDRDMVYTDARISQHYPTVEVRVGDVCLDVRDTVLVAALCRGLVEKAAREYAAGEPPPLVSTSLLRLATWHASRTGVEGDLLDPVNGRPRPAHDVVDDLVAHLAPVLAEYGDLGLAEEGTRRILAHGTGARRQREVLARTGDLDAVVADLVRRTTGEC